MQDALCNTYLACLLFPFQLWLWSFFRDLFTRSLPLLGTIITGLVHQKSTFAVFAAVNVFCPFVPFNLFCQLVRHSASVRRALLHFFFFLLIVVAAAELSPLFLGLFSTFSLRLFGLLRHFEGRPPRSVCARARCPRPPVRPSSRRLSVRSTVAACNHPPCVAHAFVSMLSCLQFMLTPPSFLLSRWPLARPPSPNCISFR